MCDKLLKAIRNHWRYRFLDCNEQPYLMEKNFGTSYEVQTEINVMHIHSVQKADPLKYNLLDNNLKGSTNELISYCEFMVYLDIYSIFIFLYHTCDSYYWNSIKVNLFIHDITLMFILHLLSKLVAHTCYIMKPFAAKPECSSKDKGKGKLKS